MCYQNISNIDGDEFFAINVGWLGFRFIICEFVFCDCNYNEFVMYKHVCDKVCIKNCSVLTLVNY
jgi:hypothetical protein